MKLTALPYFAVGIGVPLMLVVVKGSQAASDGSTLIPLLTLLVVSEFAFFLNAVGVFIGIKQIRAVGIQPLYALVTVFCVLLAIAFMGLGVKLWPL
ncbi:hypothetical protein [Kaarinaea lacus]